MQINTSHRNFLGVILIAALGCVLYVNSLGNSFVYDDELVVEGRSFLSSWDNLRYFNTPRYFTGSGEYTYRPVKTLSYFFDFIRGHGKAAAFHQTNMILHILCGFLLYFFLLNLMPFLDRTRDAAMIALFASLLFVAHPVQTESVDSIGYRHELLYVFFSLASLLSFVAYRRKERRRWLILSALGYLLALLCKEAALPLIFVIILIDLYRRKSAAGDKGPVVELNVGHYAWHLAAILAYAYIRFAWMVLPGAVVSSLDDAVPLGGGAYAALLTSSRIFMRYLGVLLLPVKLSAEGFYRYKLDPSRSILEPRTAASVAALAALAAFALRNLWRRRLFSFCVLWFFLWLIPESNILPLNSPYAERYLYVASAGFCLFLATMLVDPCYFTTRDAKSAGSVRAKPLFVALVGILFGYSILTVNRNKVWHDRFVFWQEVTNHPPATSRAYANLGGAYFKRGKVPEAKAAYQQALKISPNYADAHKNLSDIYLESGDYEGALFHAEAAVRLNRLGPLSGIYHNQLGRVFLRTREYARASEEFEEAIRQDPFLAQAHNNLAIVFFKEGRYDSAIEQYRLALKLNPGLGNIHVNIGLAYAAKNDWVHAEESFTQALAQEPNSVAAHYQLSRVYARLGRQEQSKKEWEQAHKIDPGLARAPER